MWNFLFVPKFSKLIDIKWDSSQSDSNHLMSDVQSKCVDNLSAVCYCRCRLSKWQQCSPPSNCHAGPGQSNLQQPSSILQPDRWYHTATDDVTVYFSGVIILIVLKIAVIAYTMLQGGVSGRSGLPSPPGYTPADLTGGMCFLLYTNGEEDKLNCLSRWGDGELSGYL